LTIDKKGDYLLGSIYSLVYLKENPAFLNKRYRCSSLQIDVVKNRRCVTTHCLIFTISEGAELKFKHRNKRKRN
jgi:hypothetical protein